jgi:hypothetical protein
MRRGTLTIALVLLGLRARDRARHHGNEYVDIRGVALDTVELPGQQAFSTGR